MNKNSHKKTDWTEYYSGKKSFFSSFTQKYTMDKILSFYDQAISDAKNRHVMELGGGNSCFAESFCAARNIEQYDIADNNELAVELFEKKKLGRTAHAGFLLDLKEEPRQNLDGEGSYDFVYSIGLIEHFSPRDREQVLKNHFLLCKEGGYILISFPTPTKKYIFWRRMMEFFHVWKFWDETPLRYENVSRILEKYGSVLSIELNKKLFLTQMLVLIKKNRDSLV